MLHGMNQFEAQYAASAAAHEALRRRIATQRMLHEAGIAVKWEGFRASMKSLLRRIWVERPAASQPTLDLEACGD